MNPRVRATIEMYEPGEGWTPFRTLPLDDEQQLVVGEWLAEDFTKRLSAQAQPKNIALMTGAELWAMPDDELRTVLEGEWRCVAYFALLALVPELYTAIEARFGEPFVTELTAAVLTYKGHDGEAYCQLSRLDRADFIDRLNQDRIAKAAQTQH